MRLSDSNISRLIYSIAALIVGVSIGGCGGATAVESITGGDSGEVVDPGKVPSALKKKTGLRIQFRPGPVPTEYDAAVYGTAVNAQGVKVDFAFFFAPHVGGIVPRKLFRLVPNATDNGSSTGKSYVMISNAEYRHRRNVKLREEEFEMSSRMHWAVAALAPRAMREESP